MSDGLLYPPPGTPGSDRARYRVYTDRVELGSLLGTWVIPLAQVREATANGPLLGGLAGLGQWPWWRHLKLGWADVRRRVALEKETGWFRVLHFCPPDPNAFVAAVEAAKATSRADAEPGAAADGGGR